MADSTSLNPDAEAKINQIYVDRNAAMVKALALSKQLGAEQSKTLSFQQQMLKVAKDMQAEDILALRAAKEEGAIDLDRYKKEMDKLKIARESNVILTAHKAMLERTTALAKQDIDNMKAKSIQMKEQSAELMRQGDIIGATAAKAKQYWESLKGAALEKVDSSTGKEKAEAVKGAVDNPESMLNNMGVWGVLLKMIIDVIDQTTKMQAAFRAASAASGDFAKSGSSSLEKAMNIMDSNTSLERKYAMSSAQAAELNEKLERTGIKAFSALSAADDGMNSIGESVFTFAKNTGQADDQVIAQFAEMTRLNGLSTTALRGNYMELMGDAKKVAGTMRATTTETMQAIFSLDAQFSDMGINIQSIGDVIGGVAQAFKELQMGGTIKDFQEVASQILGISKASEGALVMMGKMNGMTGSFAKILFEVQGRDPKTGAITQNSKSAFDNFSKMSTEMDAITTRMGGDQQTKTMMRMKMMKDMFHFDDKGASAAIKLWQDYKASDGKLSKGNIGASFDKMREAAQEEQMNSKGMFDIIRELLMGFIAKPIIAIWKLIAHWQNDSAGEGRANEISSKLDKYDAAGTEKDRAGVLHNAATQAGGARGGGVTSVAKPRGSANSSHVTVTIQDPNGKQLAAVKAQQAANTGH